MIVGMKECVTLGKKSLNKFKQIEIKLNEKHLTTTRFLQFVVYLILIELSFSVISIRPIFFLKFHFSWI